VSGARIEQRTGDDLADVVQSFDTRFLVALHRGEIDIVKLAREELVSRGLDGNGRWVGFAEAGEVLSL
jgi:hypothetical protein